MLQYLTEKYQTMCNSTNYKRKKNSKEDNFVKSGWEFYKDQQQSHKLFISSAVDKATTPIVLKHNQRINKIVEKKQMATKKRNTVVCTDENTHVLLPPRQSTSTTSKTPTPTLDNKLEDSFLLDAVGQCSDVKMEEDIIKSKS
ncbi:hypothetical protein OUZ56_011954 [Daphnia magna]|uniref:Uncharacterized protein n=1 Tax=Daphnia magna TaxID=35525 RepID=A0ABQ9Z1L8_9CRUS|nr:hypothetical protein OUZ56_011954 [Daphnia magna]